MHASCSRRSAAVRDDRLPSQDVPSVSLAALASHLPATSSRGGVSSKARTSHTELDRAENHASLDRANGATPPLWSAATQGRCRAQRGGGDVRTRKANVTSSEAEGTCELGRRASRDRTTPILLARLTHHRNAAPGTSPRRRSRGGASWKGRDAGRRVLVQFRLRRRPRTPAAPRASAARPAPPGTALARISPAKSWYPDWSS